MTTKVAGRKGEGSGRLRSLKHITRRAKNGFRSGTTPKPRDRKATGK